ncbi:MAG: hypothetical protein WKF37_24500 [Bryobacteraceae bacterium]
MLYAICYRADSTGFALDNDYYTSPDAEVLFALVSFTGPHGLLK